MPGNNLEPVGYAALLSALKARVRATQFHAARAANTEVLKLYWSVGRDILDRQDEEGWGAKVVTRLAADLQREFPDQKGWSRSNLLYMRRAAECWPTEESFVQQAAGRLPWTHIHVLLDRLDTREQRDWYATHAAEEGWSRGVLQLQIRSRLIDSLGAAPSNFAATLDAPDSDMAQQLVKDPYLFEHLGMVTSKAERDVEQALMDRLRDTLLEFGRGMAFVGRQVRLSLTDPKTGETAEFYPDLLFFSTTQLRYVVVEMKVGAFDMRDAGQLSGYVAIVDDLYRDKAIHQPTVGILLCTGKHEPTVRYALASTTQPIAVADFKGLPDDARAALPSAAELQAVVIEELEHRAER